MLLRHIHYTGYILFVFILFSDKSRHASASVTQGCWLLLFVSLLKPVFIICYCIRSWSLRSSYTLCYLGVWTFDLLTCKNHRPYNLHGVGGDVKPCSINQREFELVIFNWWTAVILKVTSLKLCRVLCIAVPPKPTRFTVFADDHGNAYFNWSVVSSASSYTVYWCRRHIHVKQCQVWPSSHFSASRHHLDSWNDSCFRPIS